MLANPIDEQKHQPALHTRAEIAKAAGVSHGTLNKVKVIEAKAAPEIKAKLAEGQTTSPTRLKIHASIAVPFWAAQDVERQAHHLLRAAQPAGEMVQDDSC